MLRLFVASLTLLMVAACSSPNPSIPVPDITDEQLAAIDSATAYRYMSRLASDEMEGRGTGTVGEQRAVQFIAETMTEIGLEPGGPDGSFFQSVPLRTVRSQQIQPLALSAGGTTQAFNFVDDFIMTTDLNDPSASVSGELLFVGYGITNPGFNWDDYKDVDVAGRILVGFVNEPPATADEPTLFEADTLTYNGRWTYKYEEARRRGAKGMFLIHTNEMAGYPFTVLSSSATQTISLATPPENPLTLRGWITQPTAEALAQLAGTSLDAWKVAAMSRDFSPIETGVTLNASGTFTATEIVGTNVIGRISGTTRANEAIVITAHHDHLGKNEQLIAQGLDGIYNGAVDNAAGVAQMLMMARALKAGPAPARTILFVSLSAEESGLLGAFHYAANPVVPLVHTVANINMDGANLFGATEDIVGIGAERSDMLALMTEAATAENLTISADPRPGQGLFYRSDQLAFARAGVPAVFVNTGMRYIGQPADYYETVVGGYINTHYHQPTDQMREDFRFDGFLQQVRVAFRMAHRLAHSDIRPQWRAGEAFGLTRAEAERAAGLYR